MRPTSPSLATSILLVACLGAPAAAQHRLLQDEDLELRAADWLREHPEWRAADPMRTMGYNSPMCAAIAATSRCSSRSNAFRAARSEPRRAGPGATRLRVGEPATSAK